MASRFPDETEPEGPQRTLLTLKEENGELVCQIHENNDIGDAHVQACLDLFRNALRRVNDLNYDRNVITQLVEANSALVLYDARRRLQYLETSRVGLHRRLAAYEYALGISEIESRESTIVPDQSRDHEWQIELEDILGSQFDRLKEDIIIKDRHLATKDFDIKSLQLECSELELRLQTAMVESVRERETIARLEEERRELVHKIQQLEERHREFEQRVGPPEMDSLKSELRNKRRDLDELELRLQRANEHAVQKDEMLDNLRRDKSMLEQAVSYIIQRENTSIQSLDNIREIVIKENINLQNTLRRMEGEQILDFQRSVQQYEKQIADLKLQQTTEVTTLKEQLRIKDLTLTEHGDSFKKKDEELRHLTQNVTELKGLCERTTQQMIKKDESFNNLNQKFIEIEKALRGKEDALNNVTRERDLWKSRYHELLPRVNTEGMTSVNPDSMPAFPLNIENIQWQADISVKLPSDEINCSLSGMGLVPNNRMILCDSNNQSVKILDLKSCRLVSTVRVSSPPYDVCAIPEQRFAVSLPNEGKIQKIIIQGGLALTTSFKTRNNCRGIRNVRNTLVVTYWECNGLEILDLDGQVLKQIQSDEHGQPLFVTPFYVAVDRLGRNIYVSDHNRNTITKLDLELNVLHTFVKKPIKGPRSMFAVDDCHLLVCCRDNDKILLLNTETEEVHIFLGVDHGIVSPQYVCYSSDLKTVFVTCISERPDVRNTVKVFSQGPQVYFV